ncbi:MAG TPA: RES family NAD+ phosphorylase [Candidatus Baltobacteraceae bacterium]|nr:RES family NAD+ phosphorylase [Candidatus Baltobacteraceae bacterium]
MTATVPAPVATLDRDVERLGAYLDGSEPAEQLVAPQLGGDIRALLALTNPVERHRSGDKVIVPPEDDYVGDHKEYVLGPFARPSESRFSDGSFGVLYAGITYETARAEAAYWTDKFFIDTTLPPGSVARTQWLSFRATSPNMADVRAKSGGIASIYDPKDYVVSRRWGAALYSAKHDGVYYDSVRDKGGECVGAFVPRIVSNVRLKQVVEFVWDGARVSQVRLVDRI